MATDVFLRLYASNPLRLGLATAVLERLKMDPGMDVTVIYAEGTLWPWNRHLVVNRVSIPADEFYIRSKAVPEELTKSDPFVIIDDDHLPLYNNWLSIGLGGMVQFPQFGVLSSWSVNGEVPRPLVTERDKVHGPLSIPRKSALIWESGSLGCPMFVRKGILRNPPAGPLAEYDTILTQWIQSKEWKTGFYAPLRHNHIGMAYSQVIPGWWNPPAPAIS